MTRQAGHTGSALSQGSPPGGTTPHTVGVSFRRHNPGGLLQAAQPHILWGSPLGGTTPHTVVSLRFPGDQLSTSRPQQTNRPGGQVILAQPSASSRGSRSSVLSGHQPPSLTSGFSGWSVYIYFWSYQALHLLLVISLILLCITT